MKKLNLVLLLILGVMVSSFSFASTVSPLSWAPGSGGSMSFGSSISETGDVAIDELLGSEVYGLDAKDSGISTISFYFSTLQEVIMTLSTTAIVGSSSWTTALTGPGVSDVNASATGPELLELSESLNVGSYIYTISNLDTVNGLVFNLSSAIANTPIPAAFLLFGTVFVGLFGVKSFKSRKLVLSA